MHNGIFFNMLNNWINQKLKHVKRMLTTVLESYDQDKTILMKAISSPERYKPELKKNKSKKKNTTLSLEIRPTLNNKIS